MICLKYQLSITPVVWLYSTVVYALCVLNNVIAEFWVRRSKGPTMLYLPYKTAVVDCSIRVIHTSTMQQSLL